jgi:hypothetical protein
MAITYIYTARPAYTLKPKKTSKLCRVTKIHHNLFQPNFVQLIK